jgi:hypothetical protein
VKTRPTSRRRFVRALLAGSAALPLLRMRALAATSGEPKPHPIDALLPGFRERSVADKIQRVERLTTAARAHPSGIFVCMPKVDHTGLRQVRTQDFDGMDKFAENFGLRFKSVTDFFDNENSITTSGSHLAAQSTRYLASREPSALAAAEAAFASLRRIHEFGVEQGRPGFLGKPYHFEYSTHTTGDQYLHALWGLWTFLPIAPPARQAEIRAMITSMADHMIATDFTTHYADGRSWNMREDPTDYNAIMAALVAAAYRVTGDAKYRDSCRFVMRTGKWTTHRRLDLTISRIREGKWNPPRWGRLAGAEKRPDEFVHWEEIQHCQFTAIAASIIHEALPELLSAEELSRVVALWWDDFRTGFDRKNWGYLYWFFVSAKDRSWRPCPRTPRAPRDLWIGGHPMISFTAPWIYGDCMARFLWTAVVVARHCPDRREEAAEFCRETYRRLRPDHLLWISDPDGKQIPAELKYFTEFLSSEVPECLIASYWEGRRLKLWT